MSFSGWVATLAGWYVTEVGRQPYLVSGVLTTQDAVTGLPPANIAMSFSLYAALYVVLLIAYIRTLTLMCRKSVGIEEISAEERAQAKQPLSPIQAN
jgi:cytochrome d ubiquinol oxidase subunit I